MTDSNFIKPLDSFVSEVINYLPDYLRKDNLVKFMTVFLDRLEALDNSFIQLAEYRLLVNAQGVVLDDIGTQMGLYRNGQSDDDFRTIILIRQAAAGKGGTAISSFPADDAHQPVSGFLNGGGGFCFTAAPDSGRQRYHEL